MATVEQRYQAATEYVKRAIRTVELGALHTWGSFLPAIFATETYAGQVKTENVKSELSQIEARWLRAASDIDGARVARDAELLADRVEENLPGAPTDWTRTNLYPGEGAHATGATSYSGEAGAQADEAWSWIRRKASDAIDETKTLGKWLLIGGGVLLGIKAIEYLDEPERRRDRATVPRNPGRVLNASLERVASRNAQPQPETMCPVCHRYHFTDTDGRLIPHEYPISDVCPGSGRLPLAVTPGGKAERKATKATKTKPAPSIVSAEAKPLASKSKAKKPPKVKS